MQNSHTTIPSIVADQIGHMLKDYSTYPIKGSLPVNFVSFEELIDNPKKFLGQKIGVLVKVKNIRTFNPKDSKARFNRLVKVDNAIKYINQKTDKGEVVGFCYDYAGVLVGTLKYDYESEEWYIFINQGQHRASMAYIVGGEDVELPVIVDVPKNHSSEQQSVSMEALVHYVDATQRTGQSQPDKLRSAWFCKIPKAIYLVDFYDECGVDVGGLLNHKKSCDSWGDIEKSIDQFGEENTKRAFTFIAKYTKEDKINARAVMGLAALAYHFEDRVQNFENLNVEDFFQVITKYVFVDRKPKTISMSDLTKHSGTLKSPYWPMCVWIRYLNEMFEWVDYKRENKAHLWMSRRSREWQDFLMDNVEDVYHDMFSGRIEPN
jgi:hypothetical protein